MKATNTAQIINLEEFNGIIKEISENLIIQKGCYIKSSRVHEWIGDSPCQYTFDTGITDINEVLYEVYCLDKELVPLFHSLEILLNTKGAPALIAALKKHIDISTSEEESIKCTYDEDITLYKESLSATYPEPISEYSYAALRGINDFPY